MNKTRKYILAGLMTALVFILTFSIKIPVPYTSGYIHLGDSMIYLSVIVLGPVLGAFASGVGSMLADIAGGYVQYVLPTLVIKALMAFIMGIVISAKSRRLFITSICTTFFIWAGFCAGTYFYINKQIDIWGTNNIINMVLGTDADPDAIIESNKLINNLPVYFTAGIAVIIVIFAIIAYLVSRHQGTRALALNSVIGMSAAGICMVMGYFIVESFMYSPIAAIFSIPPNMVQFFGGLIVAVLLAPAFIRAKDNNTH
ncbi:MAG: ECF transporter S component [Clostridiaceae bacterium]|nr:ECF transporter S component [Clostridiaceae bacterium]